MSSLAGWMLCVFWMKSSVSFIEAFMQIHLISLIMMSDLFIVVVAALSLEYLDKDGHYASKGTVN